MHSRRQLRQVKNEEKYVAFTPRALSSLVDANLDTTGNGLLDVDECAAVTSLAGIFSVEDPDLPYSYLDVTDLYSTDIDTAFFGKFPNLTEIGNRAFQQCVALTSVDLTNLPTNITSLSGAAFAGCTGLTSITLPSHITSLETESLCLIPGIGTSSVDLTIDLGNITYFSPTCCRGLRTAAFPFNANTTYIGAGAFSRAHIPFSVIPASVTTVGDSAFEHNDAITAITYASSANPGNEAFTYCSNMTTFTFTGSITMVRNLAFAYCTSLTSVTLPNSLTGIDNHAFYNTPLTALTYLGTQSQWNNNVTLYSYWNAGTSITTIHCTDGDITISS